MSQRRPGDPSTPGPHTPEGKATALANLTPEVSAIKPGRWLRDGVFMKCARCVCRLECADFTEGGDCPMEQEYIRDRRSIILRELPHLNEALDGPALSVLLWQEVRIARVAQALAVTGEFYPVMEKKPHLEYVPVAEKLSALIGSWRSTLIALGLTPGERKRLEGTGETGPAAQLARAFAELAERERAEKQRAVDAELVTDDGAEGTSE
jgi:hypothetical protein